MEESGCRMDHPVAAKFRTHVMSGDWIKAHADLQELKNLLEDQDSLLVSYSLRQKLRVSYRPVFEILVCF